MDNQIIIAGLDEVGRGPWAGPIIACAYIEIVQVKNVKITDSKKMNQAQREQAYEFLIKSGHYGLGAAESHEIDTLGLSKANLLAFHRAIKALPLKPDLILIDGRDKITLETTNNIPFKTFIRGDSLIKAISCASIIAKVTRDRLMTDYAKIYPKYHFESHKGYGTRQHLNALKKHGVSPLHRLSFKPVKLQSLLK